MPPAWDDLLFAGAAPFYERGRLPYPAGLASAFASHADLTGRPRLLDVGCGPGTVARRLAHLFDEVIGVDPDAGMLAEAERLAAEDGVTNARWVRSTAEDLPADLGPFRCATFAQSFHWMDRPLVAARTFDLLDPGGAFVHVDTGDFGVVPLRGDEPHPPVPDDAIAELRTRYLGPGRRAGRRTLDGPTPSGEAEVLAAAGYQPPTVVDAGGDDVLERTVDDVVASVLSTSNAAPHLFGDRLPDFVDDLRALLHEASPTARFSVRTGRVRLVFYRRPRA